MKTKSLFLLSALALLLLTACGKEQIDSIDYYFCSTNVTDEGQWTLYVDGDFVGQLTNSTVVPACNDTAALSGMLHLTLSEERHEYEAKDPLGTVRSTGYFKCKEKANGAQSSKLGSLPNGLGGSTLTWNCDHVIVSVFE